MVVEEEKKGSAAAETEVEAAMEELGVGSVGCKKKSGRAGTKSKKPPAPPIVPTSRMSLNSSEAVRSPVMSWCSVSSVKDFCQSFSSHHDRHSLQDPPLSPITACTSPTGSTRPKCSDISSTLSASKSIHLVTQEYEPRPSYSDDPFAPPTPRGAYQGSLSLSQGSEGLFRSSTRSTQSVTGQSQSHAGTGGMMMSVSPAGLGSSGGKLAVPEAISLPSIARLSKLEFSDWDSLFSIQPEPPCPSLIRSHRSPTSNPPHSLIPTLASPSSPLIPSQPSLTHSPPSPILLSPCSTRTFRPNPNPSNTQSPLLPSPPSISFD